MVLLAKNYSVASMIQAALRSVLLPFCLVHSWGQQPAPIGVLRGEIAELSPSGMVDVKTLTGTVYRCRFDAATEAERDYVKIAAQALKRAELVEIVTERRLGACYARKIQVVDKGIHRTPLRPARLEILEQIFPRGNLTYSGVVLRHTKTTLVMRTRTQGELTLTIRDDTRFLDSGAPGDLAKLMPNTRVFVRGGRNLDSEVELYQVVWGTIDGPNPIGP